MWQKGKRRRKKGESEKIFCYDLLTSIICGYFKGFSALVVTLRKAQKLILVELDKS